MNIATESQRTKGSRTSFFFALLCALVFLITSVTDAEAQRSGRYGGAYRPGPPAPQPSYRGTNKPPPISSPKVIQPRINTPPKGSPQKGNLNLQRKTTASPQPFIANNPAFKGLSKAGSPIIRASGKNWSIPKSGVISKRSTSLLAVSTKAVLSDPSQKTNKNRMDETLARVIANSQSVGAARNPRSVTKEEIGDKKTSLERKSNPASLVNNKYWDSLKPHKGNIKTNGLKGRKERLYTQDRLHGDIEVFDRHGVHLGSIDPVTGIIYKPKVKGRTINTR